MKEWSNGMCNVNIIISLTLPDTKKISSVTIEENILSFNFNPFDY